MQSNNKVSFTFFSRAKIFLKLEITTWVLRNVFTKRIKQKYYYEAEAETCNFTKKDRFQKYFVHFFYIF